MHDPIEGAVRSRRPPEEPCPAQGVVSAARALLRYAPEPGEGQPWLKEWRELREALERYGEKEEEGR